MKILVKRTQGETRRNRMVLESKLCGNQEWYRSGTDYERRLQELDREDHGGLRNGLATRRHGRRQHHDDRYIESVMFIPHTPESMLKPELSRLESRLGFRTRYRYVQETGRTLAWVLCTKDPDRGQ